MTAIFAGDETGDEGGEGGASSAEEEQTAEDAVAAADPPRRNRQLSSRAEALAAAAKAAAAATCGPLLTRPAVHYPEPSYKVERAYPALQALGAPAVTSPTLPSQEKYLGVWCVNQPYPRHGHGVVFG